MTAPAPVTIGAATLYCGDSRDILPDLERAALVATDPPYLLTSGGANAGLLGPAFGDYQNNGQLVPVDITWPEIMAVVYEGLQPAGDAFIMCDDRNLEEALTAARAAGLKLHRVCIWEKPNGTPNRWFMKNAEFAIYVYKGRARTINDCGSKQVYRAPPGTDTAHPTQKPVALMRHYIENASAPGDLVIDPFLGSGTTAIAALAAGRRFIGIEKKPEFFDIAVARLRGFTTGAAIDGAPDLFSRAV